MRASFNMKKVVYDVSDPVALCNNQTTKCTLPLGFLSNEQVSAWVVDIERDRSLAQCNSRSRVVLNNRSSR